jgi:von Willebrand factor type A domain/Aerotolerance regulator N-terminal
MNLLNPVALALAGLAVPIVIFYVLKIRLRRVPVSTLLFWQRIFDEKQPRSLWQRLRHLLSLLLQLAFLGLLVVALADPIFRWQQTRQRRVVLVLDNSSSMNARDVAPTRLAVAKTQGDALIDGMRPGDEVAIVVAGAVVRVACGPTDHQRTLRAALASIEAGDGPTRLEEAVALARRLLSGSDKLPKIVIVSDGCADAAAGLARDADIELVAIGKPTGNVGITRMQARRSLLDPIGYEILVEVSNAALEPASCRLELDLDDDPIDVVPLNLQPGERNTQVFEKTSAAGGHLRAHIDRDDALPADNTAWAILPRRQRQRVVLFTPGNLFLEKVFEAMPLVDLEVKKVEDRLPVPAAPGRPASGALTPITVYHRRVPEVLPPGPVLVIEPQRAGALWQLGAVLHNPVVAKEDKESPLMAHVRLGNVVMPAARKLTFTGPARVLAESAGGDPLYAILDRPEGAAAPKVVVLNVALDESDLPLQTAFPIMAANLLNWFGGTKGEITEALAAGAVAEIELPPEKTLGATLTLVSPSGRETPLVIPADTRKIAVGPLDRAGTWQVVRNAGAGGRSSQTASAPAGAPALVEELACNVADRRESDIRPPRDLPERAMTLASGLWLRPIWYYLLGSAWLLVCWEWFLYQRRWID